MPEPFEQDESATKTLGRFKDDPGLKRYIERFSSGELKSGDVNEDIGVISDDRTTAFLLENTPEHFKLPNRFKIKMNPSTRAKLKYKPGSGEEPSVAIEGTIFNRNLLYNSLMVLNIEDPITIHTAAEKDKPVILEDSDGRRIAIAPRLVEDETEKAETPTLEKVTGVAPTMAPSVPVQKEESKYAHMTLQQAALASPTKEVFINDVIRGNHKRVTEIEKHSIKDEKGYPTEGWISTATRYWDEVREPRSVDIRRAFAGAYSKESLMILHNYVSKNVNENWSYSFYSRARDRLEKQGISKEKVHEEANKIQFEALAKVAHDHLLLKNTGDFAYYQDEVDWMADRRTQGKPLKEPPTISKRSFIELTKEIKEEKQGAEEYKEKAQEADTSKERKTYEGMAKDEERHAKQLESMKPKPVIPRVKPKVKPAPKVIKTSAGAYQVILIDKSGSIEGESVPMSLQKAQASLAKLKGTEYNRSKVRPARRSLAARLIRGY